MTLKHTTENKSVHPLFKLFIELDYSQSLSVMTAFSGCMQHLPSL